MRNFYYDNAITHLPTNAPYAAVCAALSLRQCMSNDKDQVISEIFETAPAIGFHDALNKAIALFDYSGETSLDKICAAIDSFGGEWEPQGESLIEQIAHGMTQLYMSVLKRAGSNRTAMSNGAMERAMLRINTAKYWEAVTYLFMAFAVEYFYHEVTGVTPT